MPSFLIQSFWAVSSVVLIAVLIAALVPDDPAFQPNDWHVLAANKTIVVTGANSGLGYATVEHLAKLGTARAIVLACRRMEQCDQAKERAAQLMPSGSRTKFLTAKLDLASRSSIESFAKELPSSILRLTEEKDEELSGEVSIDVLVNNAGIFASKLNRNYINDLEEHMSVNHLGHVLMTHLLWPTLVRSKARLATDSLEVVVFPPRTSSP